MEPGRAFVEMDLTSCFLSCYNVIKLKVVHILPHNAVKVNFWEGYADSAYSSQRSKLRSPYNQ